MKQPDTTVGEARYTEADLREAFKAGWKKRNESPGLKRQPKRTLTNRIAHGIGAGYSQMDMEYVKDHRTYSHNIWLGSAFRKALKEKQA